MIGLMGISAEAFFKSLTPGRYYQIYVDDQRQLRDASGECKGYIPKGKPVLSRYESNEANNKHRFWTFYGDFEPEELYFEADASCMYKISEIEAFQYRYGIENLYGGRIIVNLPPGG